MSSIIKIEFLILIHETVSQYVYNDYYEYPQTFTAGAYFLQGDNEWPSKEIKSYNKRKKHRYFYSSQEMKDCGLSKTLKCKCSCKGCGRKRIRKYKIDKCCRACCKHCLEKRGEIEGWTDGDGWNDEKGDLSRSFSMEFPDFSQLPDLSLFEFDDSDESDDDNEKKKTSEENKKKSDEDAGKDGQNKKDDDNKKTDSTEDDKDNETTKDLNSTKSTKKENKDGGRNDKDKTTKDPKSSDPTKDYNKKKTENSTKTTQDVKKTNKTITASTTTTTTTTPTSTIPYPRKEVPKYLKHFGKKTCLRKVCSRSSHERKIGKYFLNDIVLRPTVDNNRHMRRFTRANRFNFDVLPYYK